MKNILLLIGFITISTLSAISQEQPMSSVFFGQCMIDIDTDEEIRQLESEIRQNPYIKVARLDVTTKRAFILTNNLESLTEEQFTSWFNSYGDKVRCIQIGRHGIDMVQPYPFEGCTKD